MSGVQAEGQALRNKEIEYEQKAAQGQLTGGQGLGGVYPAKYFNTDGKTEETLRNLADAAEIAKANNFGKPSFQQELTQLAAARKLATETFNFEKWIEEKFDATDPMGQKLLQETYPEYMVKREKYIEEQFELAKRAELLNLRGVRDRDDLIFQYMLDNNAITVPRLEIVGTKVDGNEIKRGMLNINRWMSDNPASSVVSGNGALPSKNTKASKVEPLKFPSNSKWFEAGKSNGW
jgi:hypothetical protein